MAVIIDGLRWLSRILLWGMLILSTLGVIGDFTAPAPPPPPSGVTTGQVLRLQTLGAFASGFSRAWLTWDGEETIEQRKKRLRPYVSPVLLEEISRIQLKKEQQQMVTDVQPMGIKQQEGQHAQVRVWAQVVLPKRRMIELLVPVSWDVNGKPVINGVPILGNVVPPQKGFPRDYGPLADKMVKEAMRPMLETFFAAYFRGTEGFELVHFTMTPTPIRPLGGWMEMIEIQAIKVYGTGPYQVVMQMSVKDEVTGAVFPQIYELEVVEDQGKYFIADLR